MCTWNKQQDFELQIQCWKLANLIAVNPIDSILFSCDNSIISMGDWLVSKQSACCKIGCLKLRLLKYAFSLGILILLVAAEVAISSPARQSFVKFMYGICVYQFIIFNSPQAKSFKWKSSRKEAS